MISEQRGISLIELIIFIVVLGILGSGILMALVVSLEKTPLINKISRATEIAETRMEFLIGQLSEDLSIEDDPCEEDPLPLPLTEICAVPDGFQIDTTPISTDGDDANLKHISITVRDTTDSRILASFNKTVANY